MSENIREIPYNYTSYSDREIVVRFLGEDIWDDLNVLRHQRRTGRSARMLFEILGDVWVIARNPFLKNDLIGNKRRLSRMHALHMDRLGRITEGAQDNPRAKKVAARTERMLDEFYTWFVDEPKRRKSAKRRFSKHTHPNNVHFDAYTLTHSATDATDWRSHHPFCVLTPDSPEEIPGLIRAARKLGLIVIPRGGGTGLCGGSVPLHENTVMINVEKFDHISDVQMANVGDREVATITAQAGAVTGKVMEASKPYVFATDPTSLWACTIGGNVASNAGGKHAVIWGTCVDNLLSWKMVTPEGRWLMVERLNHNMGKIPADAEVQFRLSHFEADGVTPSSEPETLNIHGSHFRKDGLGKDVTRKALGGLPGVQKEGTDGFITEATFVVHQPFECTRTVCSEFFGQELTLATRAMVKIKEYVDSLPDVHLEGLEHFDQKYVKAIDYISKSTRRELPRVVLLIDVSGDNEETVAKACAEITRITSHGDGEGFVAISQQDRNRFWSDRTRMAAIARHTRAFKLNEDVVIPLPRLSEYNDYVEHLNIENSICNKIEVLEKQAAYLRKLEEKLGSDDALAQAELGTEDDGYMAEKLNQCLQVICATKKRWCGYMKGLDLPAEDLEGLEGVELKKGDTLFRIIQRGGFRISYHDEVESPVLDRLRGHDALIGRIRKIHREVLSSRIVVATHMHAGDGNVHTNIPVNSNDYAMMKKAHHVVEKIMAKAEELGGVISGEHGIGITKLPYLNREYLDEVSTYLKQADPNHLFNRSKLMPDTDLSLTYTPSFNLLEMEAVIMEAADLTGLAEDISPCLRCGKCKPVCNTHFPRANMLYSPRNKIQASGAIIEAFLYESQTGGGISFEQFEGMHDVANHCTICHKCESPCPVNIDFGVVTEKMRALLKDKGQSRANIGSRISLWFLVLQHPDAVRLVREVVIRWGYRAHRLLNKVARSIGLVNSKPAAKRNLEGVQAQVVNFVERPLPGLQIGTARSALGIESREENMVPVLRDPSRANGKAVFYFPGCGSERLFSQVGLATQAALYDLGVNVVLPPSYICCGYPSTASGDHEQGEQITYDNRVLFHRIRNALSYLDFEAVIVSCGTCYDQLSRYELEQVFPDAPLIDIHEYLMSQGVKVEAEGSRYMYHEPCHTPLKRHGSAKAIHTLLGHESVASEQCCGEAGTMAVAHPTIAGKIRSRKEEEMSKASSRLDAEIGVDGEAKVLTSCPSCLQGLSRLEGETGVDADYIVVELMRQLHGEDWQKKFVDKIKKGGIERILM